MSASGDPVVASVGDSALHASDAALIGGTSWWNDALISFYLEHLAEDVFAGDERLLFVSPATVMLLGFAEASQLADMLAPLRFGEREFIFLPINDNTSTDSVGGLHWSLLVVEPAQHTARHYDSMKGHNASSASRLARSLASLLGKRLAYSEARTPQQPNGYDCGVFVCMLAEQTALRAASSQAARERSLLASMEGYCAADDDWMSDGAASEFRGLMKHLVQRYRR